MVTLVSKYSTYQIAYCGIWFIATSICFIIYLEYDAPKEAINPSFLPKLERSEIRLGASSSIRILNRDLILRVEAGYGHFACVPKRSIRDFHSLWIIAALPRATIWDKWQSWWAIGTVWIVWYRSRNTIFSTIPDLTSRNKEIKISTITANSISKWNYVSRKSCEISTAKTDRNKF